MHELTLDALSFGADAVGRLDGKVVFVAGGVPGDRVRVRILREHARYLRAELCEVVEAGAARRQPPCALAGRCGGCQWQHVAYPAQLEAKRSLLLDALARLPGGAAALPALTMHAAPEPLGYRRRARLTWRGRELGYRARGSRDVVDVADGCAALSPPLEKARAALRDALARYPGRGSLALLAGRDDAVHASLRVEGGAAPPPDALLVGGVVGGVVDSRAAGGASFGEAQVDIGDEGTPLWASSAGFAQANAAQDRALRARVGEALAAVAPNGVDRALELHAGIGNLTRVLAGAAKRVLAVEASSEAAAALKRNTAGLPAEVDVRQGRAEPLLDQLAAAIEASGGAGEEAGGERFGVVLLDPPREGCRAALAPLCRLAPGAIVYVSCDPMTLARDLGELTQCGYALTSLQALDMMPQTFHLEVVAALVRGQPSAVETR